MTVCIRSVSRDQRCRILQLSKSAMSSTAKKSMKIAPSKVPMVAPMKVATKAIPIKAAPMKKIPIKAAPMKSTPVKAPPMKTSSSKIPVQETHLKANAQKGKKRRVSGDDMEDSSSDSGISEKTRRQFRIIMMHSKGQCGNN